MYRRRALHSRGHCTGGHCTGGGTVHEGGTVHVQKRRGGGQGRAGERREGQGRGGEGRAGQGRAGRGGEPRSGGGLYLCLIVDIACGWNLSHRACMLSFDYTDP